MTAERTADQRSDRRVDPRTDQTEEPTGDRAAHTVSSAALEGPSADALFTALGDPTRRRILVQLGIRPDDAGAVGRSVGISRQAAAKHLRILEDAGLVLASTHLRRRVHATDPARIREVSDLLGTLATGWERRLQTIAAQAEAAQAEAAAAQAAPPLNPAPAESAALGPRPLSPGTR